MGDGGSLIARSYFFICDIKITPRIEIKIFNLHLILHCIHTNLHYIIVWIQIDLYLTYKLSNNIINKNNNVNKIDNFVLSAKPLSSTIVFILTNCLTI